MVAANAQFTDEENEFLLNDYGEESREINTLGAKTIIEIDGVRITRSDDFLNRVIAAFVQEFPYRSPNTAKSKISQTHRKLQYKKDEWPHKLREHIRNRFNYFRRLQRGQSLPGGSEPADEGDSEGSTSKEDAMGVGIQVEGGQKSEESDQSKGKKKVRSKGRKGKTRSSRHRVEDEEMESGSDASEKSVQANRTSATGSVVETMNPSDEDHKFAILGTRSDSWDRSLDRLRKLSNQSWAAYGNDRLAARQKMVPDILRDVLDILAYSTGCELYATGAFVKGEDAINFEAVSPRAELFLHGKAGEATRNQFTQFLADYLGPSLCTDLQCPGPAIYPNTKNLDHPTFPVGLIATQSEKQRLLFDYISLILQWQGGSPHVPYGLIEEEHERGENSIVLKDALPDLLQYLKHPMLMSEAETTAMVEHLIAGNKNALPSHRVFRFHQWAENQFENWGPQIGDWEPRIYYHPDSRVFCAAMAEVTATQETLLPPTLLSIYPSEPPYLSFNQQALDAYAQTVSRTDPWWDLQGELQEHDKLFPVQATLASWAERVQEMPHLIAEPPFPESAGNHLVTKKGYLPAVCFDWRNPAHDKWKLPTTLEWCRPNHWIDTPSGTLLGGSMGVKWPVVILGHLSRNVHRYRSESEAWVRHYSRHQGDAAADIVFMLDEEVICQVNASIEALRKALSDSKVILSNMYTARLERGRDELVLERGASAHLNFPREPSKFKTVRCLPPINEWHDDGEIQRYRGVSSSEAEEAGQEPSTGFASMDVDSEPTVESITLRASPRRVTRKRSPPRVTPDVSPQQHPSMSSAEASQMGKWPLTILWV